jgi:hypothetical protein
MMPSLSAQLIATPFNPLDAVEDVMISRDLNFDRPVEEEIVGEIASLWGTLRLWYRWEEALGLMVFSCAMEGKIGPLQRSKIYPLLAAINEKIWLGHFDFASEEGAVIFRHSLMLGKSDEFFVEQIENLLEIATTECDRFYPALQAVIWGNQSPADALNLAMFETAGEA